MRSCRLLRAGRLCQGLQLAQVPGEDRVLGAGRQLQRPQAGLDGGRRRLSECRRNLYRLYDAGIPRQVHAVYGSAARLATLFARGHDLWEGHSRAAQIYSGIAQ